MPTMPKTAAGTFSERFGRGSGIYLVDFAVFKPPDELLTSRKEMAEAGERSGLFTPESMELMKKMAHGEALGMGEVTAIPVLKGRSNLLNMTKETPLDQSVEACVEECEMVMYPTVDAALQSSRISATEVDYVITSNSTFNPIPSLSAMVCNHFKMRCDVVNYSVSGHGCTSGLLLIDMAKNILKANPNKVVLVVAHDSILPYFYTGNKKEFLLSNVMFRLGGAAILLSNRRKDAKRAKYELVSSVRVLKADTDDSHNCIKMHEDEERKRCVVSQGRLVKPAAEEAAGIALARIAPRILPLSELMKAMRDKQYSPDFSKAVQHLAMHTAPKFVVEGIAESLRFPPESTLPCLETLYRFGNTSAASTFYVLANIESRGAVKRGDRVLQMSMGSGFKCIMTVWRARKNINTPHPAWDNNPLYNISSIAATVGPVSMAKGVAELHAINKNAGGALTDPTAVAFAAGPPTPPTEEYAPACEADIDVPPAPVGVHTPPAKTNTPPSGAEIDVPPAPMSVPTPPAKTHAPVRGVGIDILPASAGVRTPPKERDAPVRGAKVDVPPAAAHVLTPPARVLSSLQVGATGPARSGSGSLSADGLGLPLPQPLSRVYRVADSNAAVRDPGTVLPTTLDGPAVPRLRSATGGRTYQSTPEPVSPFPIRGILDPTTPLGPQGVSTHFASAREAPSTPEPLATQGDATPETPAAAPAAANKTPADPPRHESPTSVPARETVSERVARLQPHIAPQGVARGLPSPTLPGASPRRLTPPASVARASRAATPPLRRLEVGGGLIRQAAASIFARDAVSPRPGAQPAQPQSAKDKFMSAKARFEAAAKLRFDGPSRTSSGKSATGLPTNGSSGNFMYPDGGHMSTLAKVHLVQEFASPRAQHAGIANY